MSEGDSFCWFDRLSGEQKDAALNHMLECIAARNGKLLDLQDSNNLIAEIVHSGAPRAANIFVRHAQQGNGADLVPAIRKCLAQRSNGPPITVGTLIHAAHKCGANLEPWSRLVLDEQRKGDARIAANTPKPELARGRESPSEAPWDESFVPEPHVCIHCKLDPPDGTERALDGDVWIHSRCEAAYITARMAEEGLSQEDAPSPQPPPSPEGIVDNPLAIARGYLERGWNPIPVSRRTKKPIGNGWQHRRLDSETVIEAFNRADMNVGVQLGPMSSGLTDVDLDCPEAVAIGSMLLPDSNNIFGRAGKPRSHWLYGTTLADKIAKACLQFKDVDGTMMLELKIGGGGKGTQSVFPGSTHTSGEAIEWDQDGELVTVDDDKLLQQVRCLAVAVILARHWPAGGSRHDAALTVGGFLARAGLNENDVVLMLKAIATAAGDEEREDRARTSAAAVTFLRPLRGRGP